MPKTSIIYKGAFQRIVTSAEMHGFLAMTNQLLFVTNTAEVQSTRMVTITHYQPLALQWAVGCCPTATSERRRIRLKADYHYFALRGASIRRSRWDNTRPPTIQFHFLRRFLPHTKRNGVFAVPCLFFLFLSLSRSHFARYLLANSASASSNALRITLSMS